MEIESITCNQCGGPLKVPNSVQFVTCNHCDTQLAIHREKNITFTEQLENISERTGTLESELRQLTIDNQLVAHDQWWNKEREKYLVSTNHRGMQEPMEGRGVLGAILAIVLGGFLSVLFFTMINISSQSSGDNHGYKAPEYFSSIESWGQKKRTEAEIKKNKEEWKAYHKKVSAYREKNKKSHIIPNLILFTIFVFVIGLIAKGVYSIMEETYTNYQKAYQAYLKKRESIAAGDELPDSLKET